MRADSAEHAVKVVQRLQRKETGEVGRGLTGARRRPRKAKVQEVARSWKDLVVHSGSLSTVAPQHSAEVIEAQSTAEAKEEDAAAGQGERDAFPSDGEDQLRHTEFLKTP